MQIPNISRIQTLPYVMIRESKKEKVLNKEKKNETQTALQLYLIFTYIYFSI